MGRAIMCQKSEYYSLLFQATGLVLDAILLSYSSKSVTESKLSFSFIREGALSGSGLQYLCSFYSLKDFYFNRASFHIHTHVGNFIRIMRNRKYKLLIMKSAGHLQLYQQPSSPVNLFFSHCDYFLCTYLICPLLSNAMPKMQALPVSVCISVSLTELRCSGKVQRTGLVNMLAGIHHKTPLHRKLHPKQISEDRAGTLHFHPQILPSHSTSY